MYSLSLSLLLLSLPHYVSSSMSVYVSLRECIEHISPDPLFLPYKGDAYNNSRVGCNFRYDNYWPGLILVVRRVEDVQAALMCAAEQVVEVVVVNGGHSMEGMSCTNGLLLQMDDFHNVTAFGVGAEKSDATITVQGGMRLGRLYGSIIDLTRGLKDTYIFGGGTCPTVGISGHILCGGYGLLGRLLGLTSDQVVSIDVVNAQGAVVTANASSNLDLFWALRGSCGSCFGVVVSVTLRLYLMPSPELTRIDVPDILYSNVPGGIQALNGVVLWWQEWATRQAAISCTSALHIKDDRLSLQILYVGTLQETLDNTLDELWQGLHKVMEFTTLFKSYKSGSFLDSVVWWSHDENITTVDDLLSVISLQSLAERDRSRRKTKSALLMQPMDEEAVQSVISMLVSGNLNQFEIKAYSYQCNHQIQHEILAPGRFSAIWDDKSPLRRGHAMEVHYGNSYAANEWDDISTLDANLVQQVNIAGNVLLPFTSGDGDEVWGYPGYIDRDLSKPGYAYFGLKNSARLFHQREKFDKENVLMNSACEYLWSTI
mmetsp:Transcript_4929/g.7525  ORF Transcript_4929/g.7525 Transcript_4929/m.7525 type:complete len:543 (-) Transcript_4929:143-1771(-)